MRVTTAVGQTLVRLGTRRVFGLLGSGNFYFANALVAAGAEFTAARHEGGAITMADAYARLSRSVGVVTVHQGPGLTNALTGLAEAAKSRTPLVLVAADTSAGARRSNFWVDQAGLAASVGAVCEKVASASEAEAITVRAHDRARRERRPVLLSLPLDVQSEECDLAGLSSFPEPGKVEPVAPDPAAVGRLVELLTLARRPLLIAGRGAVLAGAGPELERLAERTGALLATSAAAHGLFAGSPWSLGISGGFASPVAAELIGQADLVVGFGVALNMWTTRHGRFIGPDAKVVQVDIEAEAIGAHRRVDLGVVADAAATARALLADLGPWPVPHGTWRQPEVAARIASGSWRQTAFEDAGGAGRIDPRTLSIELDRLLPDQRLVAVDSGHFMGWAPMYWRIPDEQGFVFTQAFQSVGLGLATAIGAALARPDRLPVAVLGDGGLLMSLPELETAVRLDLPMLVVVYNDAAYGAEVHHFRPQGADVDLVRFPETDFARLAAGFGAEGLTVRAPADLARVGSWLAGDRRPPLVVDAKINPEVVAGWLEEAFRGH